MFFIFVFRVTVSPAAFSCIVESALTWTTPGDRTRLTMTAARTECLFMGPPVA